MGESPDHRVTVSRFCPRAADDEGSGSRLGVTLGN